MWPAIIAAAASLAGTAAEAGSQHKANRLNIKMQREQRAWEENMANTAIRRRADDFEAAGFNRLLAATGPGASSPSVSPATVQPTVRNTAAIVNSAQQARLTEASLENTKASTELTTAKARQEKEVADWMTSPDMREGGTLTHYQSQQIAKLVTTKMDALKAETSKDMSAAQLKQFEAASDAVVQTVKQQAERGKIDLDAIKSVIENFGLGAQDKANLIKAIMQIIIPLLGAK